MKVTKLTVKSNILVGNALADKTDRDVVIYSPDNPAGNAPLLIGLPAFANDPDSFNFTSPVSESFASILNRLYEKEMLRKANVAVVDCSTRLGGNYYLNSSAVGQYENYLIKEVIPELKKKYPTNNIGLFGKGSGGFGAYTLCTRNPGMFQGFAAHSPDSGFEYFFLPDFSDAMEEFRSASGAYRWLEKYWQSYNRIASRKIRSLRVLCASAFFSASTNSKEMGVNFPFDWDTGEFNMEVWSSWQKLDPAKNVKSLSRQLEALKSIFIDAGTMDEFSAIWGARSISHYLTETKIAHTYEEYEDGHFGVNYRFERSLPALAQSLG